MPWRKYENATDDEAIAIMESLQRRSSTGEVAFVTVPGGGQMSRSWQNTNHVDKELRMIQYELWVRGRTDIISSNPYAARIKKTHPSYVQA